MCFCLLVGIEFSLTLHIDINNIYIHCLYKYIYDMFMFNYK